MERLPDDTCYYDLLKVKRDATEQEINKAYKKLAVKYHPDKNPGDKALAEENFKKVCEAYEVLSNKEKRQTYDQFGRQGLNSSGMGGGGFSRGQAEEIFARKQHCPLHALRSVQSGLALPHPAFTAARISTRARAPCSKCIASPLPSHLRSPLPCVAFPPAHCTPTSQNSSVARIRSACSSARWARAACHQVESGAGPL